MTVAKRKTTHKGNMAAVVIFSLLAITLIVATLSWTFSMQGILQRKAEQGTKQYTDVSCTTLLSSAVIQDLCGMTAGKGQGIMPNTITGYNEILKSIQDSLFPGGKYKIQDPSMITSRFGDETQRTSVQSEIMKQTNGAKLNASLGGDLVINESDSRNRLQYQGFDRAYLQPFTLEVALKSGKYTVHQVYALSDLAFLVVKNGNELSARFDDSIMKCSLESQWIDTTDISIAETST